MPDYFGHLKFSSRFEFKIDTGKTLYLMKWVSTCTLSHKTRKWLIHALNDNKTTDGTTKKSETNVKNFAYPSVCVFITRFQPNRPPYIALHIVKTSNARRLGDSACWCKFMVWVSNSLVIRKNGISITYTWLLSQKICNRLVHALNGNPMVKKKSGRKVKNFATSSFVVGDRSRISRALTKFCSNEVEWRSVKHGWRFDGEAMGMQNFIVFFWESKQTASLAGKGAVKAKNRILSELSIAGSSGLPDDWKLKDDTHQKADWSDQQMSIDFSELPPSLNPIPEVKLNPSLCVKTPNLIADGINSPDAKDIFMHTVNSSNESNNKLLLHHSNVGLLSPPNVISPIMRSGDTSTSVSPSWANVARFLKSNEGGAAKHFTTGNRAELLKDGNISGYPKNVCSIKFNNSTFGDKQKKHRYNAKTRSPNKLLVRKRRDVKNQKGSSLKAFVLASGVLDVGRVMELKVNELRSLVMELKLKIPKKVKKQALRRMIISKFGSRYNSHSSPMKIRHSKNHFGKALIGEAGVKILIKKGVCF